MLALYLRHSIVLSSDSVNNHVHVWYIAHDLWHHARLPWRMPVLAHGEAYAYPYGFVNWTTAALVWPLFGNWTVTLWTALGTVGCIVATFTAFPELRRGWWAAAVLANSAILEALLFGQQSFAWGAMLLLFGVAAWRRGHHAWAAVLVGLGQANHAAIVLPIGVLLVLLLPAVRRPTSARLLRWYALSCVIALPAVWLVFASPTTAESSIGSEISNFLITLGPRIIIVGLPVICVLLQRTGSRALAPLGIGARADRAPRLRDPAERRPTVARARAQRRRHRDPRRVPALPRLRTGRDATACCAAATASSACTTCCAPAAGSTPRCSPRDMAIRNFRDPHDYAALLCARGIDQIIHYDTYDAGAPHERARR